MKISKPVKFKEKPWGHEIWIHNSDKYCGKVLVIFENKQSSLHYHKLKDETFYIQEGTILVKTITKDGLLEEFKMNKGDVLDIPKGTKHQFIGISEKAEIFEVSTEHFDDDSIYV
jgi:mannose-6-phosphate isomerase-like protein (cupin superfamily)